MTPDDDTVEEVILCATRMTDVMSRVAIDLDAAMKLHGGASMLAASLRCEYCNNTSACDTWIAAHPEGARHSPPDFCLSAQLMQAMQPSPSSADKD